MLLWRNRSFAFQKKVLQCQSDDYVYLYGDSEIRFTQDSRGLPFDGKILKGGWKVKTVNHHF